MKTFAIFAVLFPLVMGSVCADEPMGEPPARRYDGRTVEEWLPIIKSLEFQKPEAVDAIPGLIAMMTDERLPMHLRRRSALTLGRIGEPAREAIPILSGYLDHNETATWAAKALALYRETARGAAPHLLQVLTDRSRPLSVRQTMLEPIAMIGVRYPGSIPVLTEMLRLGDPDGEAMRLPVVEALGLIGTPAASSVPPLLRLLDSEDEQLRWTVIYALQSFGPAAEDALPDLLVRLTYDPSEEVRDVARDAIAALGAPIAGPTFGRLLTDREAAVRRRAAEGLATLSVSVPRLRADLLQRLRTVREDSDAAVRREALTAEVRLSDGSPDLLPLLLAGLQSPDRADRKRAAELLPELVIEPEVLRERLVELENSDRAEVRQAVRSVLRSLP